MDKLKLYVALTPGERPEHWHVVNDISYDGINVPAGFKTDLASVPHGLKWLFKHGGRKAFGSVIHDYIYRTQKLSRKFADDTFLKAMLENEVPVWKARSMYFGVRSFGFIAWNKNKKNIVDTCK